MTVGLMASGLKNAVWRMVIRDQDRAKARPASLQRRHPSGPAKPETLWLTANGAIPNNRNLPVLLYREAIAPAGSDSVARFEHLFERNGWAPLWRNEVFLYHHYHSTAHEVLGVARGWAEMVLGGPNGTVITVEAGDVLALPIGTGRCRLGASADFQIIGAYPKGQSPDICRSAPTVDMRARIAALPVPDSDPVAGRGGPMVMLWTIGEPA
jgi:uncharacterized protein YjlB